MVLHHMSEGRSGFALQYGALHPGGPPYLRGHPLGPSPCPRRRGIRHPDGHGDRGGRAHGLTYSPESCRASPLRHRRDNSSTSRFAEPLASAPASGTKMRSERSSRPERRSPTGVLPRPVARVVPANVPHRVDRGGPAEAPATDPRGGCAREGLGHGGGAPVDRRAEQPRPRLGYRDQLRLLYGAGFDQQHPGGGVGGQAVGEHAASRTTSDDDPVIRFCARFVDDSHTLTRRVRPGSGDAIWPARRVRCR